LGCVGTEDWKPTRLPAAYRELLSARVPENRGRRLSSN
jgi:hypothetical protein